MGRRKNEKFTVEEISEAVSNSKSLGATLRYLGFKANNGTRHPWQKRLIAINNIDTSHFTGQGWNKGNICYNTDEVFAENSKTARATVRKFILRDKLIPYECAFCGNKGEWNGVPLGLELDHINGVSNDHRLENLRFLCPNCHATTDTYCGRNIRKKEKPENAPKKTELKDTQKKTVLKKERKLIETTPSTKPTVKKKREPKPAEKKDYACVDCGKRCSVPGGLCKACAAKPRRKELDIPPAPAFAKMILDFGFLEISRRYGVAPTVIKRRCDGYGIPRTRNALLEWYKNNAESELGPVSQKQPKNPRNKDLKPKMA